MKSLDILGNTDASFRMTPVLSGSDNFLLVGCISVRNEVDGKVASKETLSKLCIYTSSEDVHYQSMDCELLNQLNIPLITRDLCEKSFSLSVSFGGSNWPELVKLSIERPGCRVNHVRVPNLSLIICLVHDVVTIESDIDLFIEQQDFLYNCMEIQDETFLLGNGPELNDLVFSNMEEQAEPIHNQSVSPLNDELCLMHSLIAKYESSKAYHTNPELSS